MNRHRRAKSTVVLDGAAFLAAWWLGATVALAAPAAQASPEPAAVSADDLGFLRRQEDQQARLAQATAEISGQVSELVEEFARNNLEGADIEVLGGMRAVLSSVSDDVMPAIVAELGKAQAASDDRSARRTHALVAYARQRTSALRMRQVVEACRQHLELSELAERVRQLGDRQSTNLHDGLALARARQGPHAGERVDEFEVSLQLQASEQASLKGEIALVLGALEAWKSLDGSLFESRPPEALAFARSRALSDATARALAEIEGGRLADALGFEESVRDTLWRLASLLEPERDPLATLLDALADLDAIIAGQQALVVATRALEEHEEVAGWDEIMASSSIRRLRDLIGNLGDRVRDESDPVEIERITRQVDDLRGSLDREIRKAMDEFGLPAPGVHQQRREERVQRDQAELVDRTAFLREEIEPVAPGVAIALSEAIAPMEEAGLLLAGAEDLAGRVAGAVPREESALARLGEARAALIEEIEAARFVEDLPADRLERLKALRDEVSSLREDQIALRDESVAVPDDANPADTAALRISLAPREEALGERATRIRRAAAGPAPDAAASIAEAAGRMRAAAESLWSGVTAAAPQEAAVAALERAEAQLSDRIDGIQEVFDVLDSLGGLRERVEIVIADQHAVQDDTPAGIADPAPDPPSMEALAGRQESLGVRTGQLAQEARAPAPEASGHLDSAAAAMAGARDLLRRADPDAAGARQEQAISDLQAARDRLANRIDTLRAQLGLPPADPLAAAGGQGPPVAAAPSPEQPKSQGQSQDQGEGQTQAQGTSEGEGQGQGQGKGRGPGQGQGRGRGDQGNWTGAGGADGPRRRRVDTGRHIGLPEREQGRLRQSGSERWSPEFGDLIEQYLRNLSDASVDD